MRRAFLFIGLYHALLSVYTLLYIRPGTMAATGGPEEQARFLMEHRAAFALGWLGWALATLLLVLFFYLLREEMGEKWRPWTTFALLMAAIGAAPDLIGGAIYGGLLPRLLQGETMAPFSFEFVQFGALERLAVFLNAGLNNLLYGVGGIILTSAMARSGRGSPAVLALSWATWLSALGLSAAAFLLRENWILVTAAFTMATFVGLCLFLSLAPLEPAPPAN